MKLISVLAPDYVSLEKLVGLMKTDHPRVFTTTSQKVAYYAKSKGGLVFQWGTLCPSQHSLIIESFNMKNVRSVSLGIKISDVWRFSMESNNYFEALIDVKFLSKLKSFVIERDGYDFVIRYSEEQKGATKESRRKVLIDKLLTDKNFWLHRKVSYFVSEGKDEK